ncbi:MAG: YfhO family protein, partial [Clostridia bacterium]|nr:YfhO family protein [Clostridia bacterium]
GAYCSDYTYSDIGCYSYTVTNTAGGASLSFTLTALESGNAYVYLKTGANTIANATFTLPDGTAVYQNIDTKPYILDLGYLNKGDVVSVYAPIKEGTDGYVYLYAVTLNDEAFETGYNQLKKDSLNVTTFEERNIEGDINVSEDGILYTSINYDTGWSVYIDGEKVSADDIVPLGTNALLGVRITEGEHTVQFKYTPQGLIIGCVISVTTLIMLLLLCSLIKTGLFKFNPPLYVEEDEIEAEDNTVTENKNTIIDDIDNLLNSLNFDEASIETENTEAVNDTNEKED